MKKLYIYFFLISFILFIKCNDEIIKPIIHPEILFKVEGVVLFNSIPLENIDVFLDTLNCKTDSLGYFVFDSLKSQILRLQTSNPLYIPIDTFININKDIYLNFNVNYRSNSFFPLSIGNKWFYHDAFDNRPDSSRSKHSIEVIGQELIGYKLFYNLQHKDYSSNSVDTNTYNIYMCIQNDSLFELNCDQLCLRAPFNISIGDTFIYQECYSSNYGILSEKSNDLLKYFYTRTGISFDAWSSYYFQKGIGITKYYSAWWYYVLDKFEIK